jgi:MFS family permease
MFALLRQRNFALLWVGQFISMMGDWFLIIALPFYIYQRTGSALATGIMFIVETLPRLFLGSIAGVFVDRWNRRRTMMTADFLRASILLPMLLISTRETIWIAYIVALVQNTVSQFFSPAYSALVPMLVEEQNLAAANSLNSLGDEMTRLCGPILGGAVVGLSGLNGVVLADSASYLFSGTMILLIALPMVKTEAQSTASLVGISFTSIRPEWLQGLQLMRKKRLITALFIIVGIAMIGEGTGRAVFVPFLSRVADGNALVFSAIMTAQGVGGVAGSLMLNRVSKIIQSTTLVALGGIIGGLLVLTEVTFPLLPVVFLCTALAGGPVVFLFISVDILLQRNVPDQFRGRIFGAYFTNNTVLLLIGMALSSIIGNSVSIRPMLYAMGGFYLLAGLIALALLRPGYLNKL